MEPEKLNTYIPESQLPNINIEAFNDIATVFFKFIDTYENVKPVHWCCNAAPGHGKTAALKSLIKWMIDQGIKIPLLIVTREIKLANEIEESVNSYSPGTIANVVGGDDGNKEVLEDSLPMYQFVIIQHQRLKNLKLKFGNIALYNHWFHDGDNLKRAIIIDEKPSFSNTSIFEIGSKNNVVKWFEDLAKPILTADQAEKIKQTIISVINEQITDNLTTYTTSVPKTVKIKNLIKLINEMSKDKENTGDYESLTNLLHFKQILTKDKAGRIDEYHIANTIGKKIYVSEYINYKNMGMPILILDGTYFENRIQYKGYNCQHVKNRNDYSRLHFHVDSIKTSSTSRKKRGHPTQKTIAKRINELKKIHKNLFVLSMKNDIHIFNNLGISINDDMDNINLLNTVGKNSIRDNNSLYLTALPRRNADAYKEIALAFYPDCDLSMSKDSKSANWFNDCRLEAIYRGDLEAELNQIIHRTSLRFINSKDDIDIYIAYDDGFDRPGEHYAICETVNKNLGGKASVDYKKLYDMSLFHKDEIIKQFAKKTRYYANRGQIKLPSKVGEIDPKFRDWLKKPWKNQHKEINYILSKFNLEIVEDDRYKSKIIKNAKNAKK
ncbi:hypothetical protein [Sporolactobacillus laevolacticus]|uniref:hypothetical protein n=1 Tax=Sporolactobacillus laevolacticus TaxID=33018 RepID=UPI0025B2FA46|nr:hypothetical protein [Sporolactobacillus laevolacticus]MDN3956209.1 hypothetical protein [Sporolactobacillus laevolacticus]